MPKTKKGVKKTKSIDKSIKQFVKVIVNEKSKNKKTKRNNKKTVVKDIQQPRDATRMLIPTPAPPSTNPEYLSKLASITENTNRLNTEQQNLIRSNENIIRGNANMISRLDELERYGITLSQKFDRLDDKIKESIIETVADYDNDDKIDTEKEQILFESLKERYLSPKREPVEFEDQGTQMTPEGTPLKGNEAQIRKALESLAGDKGLLRYIFKKITGFAPAPNTRSQTIINNLLVSQRDRVLPYLQTQFQTDMQEYIDLQKQEIPRNPRGRPRKRDEDDLFEEEQQQTSAFSRTPPPPFATSQKRDEDEGLQKTAVKEDVDAVLGDIFDGDDDEPALISRGRRGTIVSNPRQLAMGDTPEKQEMDRLFDEAESTFRAKLTPFKSAQN